MFPTPLPEVVLIKSGCLAELNKAEMGEPG